MSVPTSNPSDTPGLTALLTLTEAGAHESEATLTIPTLLVETFKDIQFKGFATGATDTSVTFTYATSSTGPAPVPIPDTFWLLLAWLGGIFWFGLHRKRAA
jgi:hypothetical protein